MSEDKTENIEELQAKIAELEAASTVQDEALKEAHEALSAKDKNGSSRLEITSGKKHYFVTVPKFFHHGRIVTAEDLAKDKGLIAELIESGSGILMEKSEFKKSQK